MTNEELLIDVIKQTQWMDTDLATNHRYRFHLYDVTQINRGSHAEYTAKLEVYLVSTRTSIIDNKRGHKILFNGNIHVGITQKSASTSESFWIKPTLASLNFGDFNANLLLIITWLSIPILLIGLLIGTVTLFKSWKYFVSRLSPMPVAIASLMFLGWTYTLYDFKSQLTEHDHVDKNLQGMHLLPQDELYLNGILFGGELPEKILHQVAHEYLTIRKQIDFPPSETKEAAPIVDWTPQRWIVAMESIRLGDLAKQTRAMELAAEWMRRRSQ